MRRMSLAVWMAFGLASLAGQAGAAEARLVASARFVAAKDTFDRSEDLSMRFTLRNQGSDALDVLRWRTPIDGLQADLFDVRRDGQEVEYVGKLVKWGAPRREDYVRIPAGRALVANFDLSQAYDMSRPGHYTVRFRSEALSDATSDRNAT